MAKLLTDALTRKKWIVEGLVQKNAQSFWAPYTGTSSSAIVYKSTNLSAKEGHNTTFDYSGNITAKAIRGKNTAYGKGVQKLKFSSSIIVDRFRLPVDNGDKFDGVEFGDLEISQHSDSRSKLGDAYTRFKDQILFDAAQGLLKSRTDGQTFTPSHQIDLTGHTYNDLLDIETTLKTSTGFTTGNSRRPLQPYRFKGGRAMWLYIVDAYTARAIKQDPMYQSLVVQGDVRGANNRVIDGVIGRLGQLLIVEAPNFFGSTTPGADWKIEDLGVEIAGLRVKDANGVWAGQEGYDAAAGVVSRNMLLGAGALQLGYGKMPDYRFQPSNDFAITSESALEVWMNVQKTKLIKENEDYDMAKVTDMDWGIVTVEVTH